MSWVGTLKPQLEPPDPQPIGDTMTNENEKTKELEARIVELEELVQQLNDEIDVVVNESVVVKNMARAVCELQEELLKQFPAIYIANKIHAPTRVGMY